MYYEGYCGVVVGVWDSYVGDCGVVVDVWDPCGLLGCSSWCLGCVTVVKWLVSRTTMRVTVV